MDIFLLYLWTRLEPISFAYSFFFWMATIIALGVLVCMACEGSAEVGQRLMRGCLWCIGVTLAISIVMPTQKQAAIILAGSAILDVAKTETANRLASKSVQLIEQTLDGYLKPKDAK